MSDIRKWEDLDFDCLVNIFGRVGIESLLLDVPFVCKSWHKATLNTSCWQHLRIPACLTCSHGRLPSSFKRFLDRFIEKYHIKIFTFDRFMCFVMSRGFTKSSFLDLSPPFRFTHSDAFLLHAVEKCPKLRSLSFGLYSNQNVPNFIGKWKQLEEVTLEVTMSYGMFDEILAQIALHCKDFNSLIVRKGPFRMKHATSIAKHLPKIKNLRIELCYIEQEEMEIILESCKELEYLNVSKSGYVEKWDAEKLKQMGSHIKTSNLNAFHAYGTCWHSDFEDSDSESYNYNVDPSNSNDSCSVFERIFSLMR